MKLAILFLAWCGFYPPANAKLVHDDLNPWICPTMRINKYAKKLIDDGLYKKREKKKLNRMLQKVWCPEQSIDNGNVELKCGRGLAQTVRYTCNEGYHLTPNTCEGRRCLENRTWSGQAPVCVPDITCINDLTLPYTGKVNITRSGILCQRWADQYPHQHGVTDDKFPGSGGVSGAENYCRDPNEEGMPWCYTTLPETKWEYCDIPFCNYDCWYKGKSRLYHGTRSTTKSNRTCQAWSAQSPHRHANGVTIRFPLDLGVAAAQNFCRDPDREGAPWCYTTDPNVRWEFCDIEFC